MKKLLVMLLAVSMVLTMAFSFAACGGEDKEETSTPAADDKDPAPVESEDAPVVEPSEDAPVEEPSEDASVVSEDAPAVEDTEDAVVSGDVSADDVVSGDVSADDVVSGDVSADDVVSEEAPIESEDAPVEEPSEDAPVVEPVESEDAPVEEPSEDAPVEEPNQGGEDTDTGSSDGSPVVVPAGKTNYAAGASYTISRNMTDTDDASLFLPDASGGTTYEYWGDSNRTRLTDGITAAGADMGPNGSLEGVTVTFVGTNQIFEYVIDLGASYSDISSVVFCGVRDGVANENNRGFATQTTMIYASDTIGAWGSKLNATFSSEELEGAPLIKHQKDETSENVENYTYTFTLDTAATGRYVRIITASPVYCLQFDEIMILN